MNETRFFFFHYYKCIAEEYGCTYTMEKMALRSTDATSSEQIAKYI